MVTDLMLFKSFPTLVAYALRSFVSFVFVLILKKTSSPCDVTTYVAGYIASAPLVSQCDSKLLQANEATLMLIGSGPAEGPAAVGS